MKKASSRSQRGSKGIKGKHVLQICVVLGVCIWLIYQVKYSHDKKKEFYEEDGKKSTVLLSESEEGLVKLGRKDLLPGYHNQKENEKHIVEDEDEDEVSHEDEEKEKKSHVENGNHEEEEKEEEEEEVVEEEEEDKNKQGEEVVEEDEEENKHEEDEIDEQDHSKTTGESDELLEEEKESGWNEKEKETNHADEIDMTVDEAREEHYKADDASSAVSHESRILNTEKLKESPGISKETAQENSLNATSSEVEVQKESDLKLGEAKVSDSVEVPTTEVKDGDSKSFSSETKSNVTESQGDIVSGNSTAGILEASRFWQNETEIMRDWSQEDGAPPSGFSELQTILKLEQTPNASEPNITVSANITNKDSIPDESRNSTLESSRLENIAGSNMTEVKESSRSEGDDESVARESSKSEGDDESVVRESSKSEGDDESVEKENSRSEGDDESVEKESSNRFSTELTEEADNTSETSISQEEMDALTDPNSAGYKITRE